MKWGRTTAAAGAGYLLGSVPIGVIVGRLAAGVDVRKYGSRVSGATNVLRAAGPAAAAATFGLDSAKGYMAARIGERIGGDQGGVVAAVAAALGHSWPLWAQFKGGRSVLTCWGSLIAMDRNAAAAAAVAGAGTVAATRYVSVGALTGVSVALPRVVSLACRGVRIALIALDGELAVPCTRNPLQRGRTPLRGEVSSGQPRPPGR